MSAYVESPTSNESAKGRKHAKKKKDPQGTAEKERAMLEPLPPQHRRVAICKNRDKNGVEMKKGKGNRQERTP